MTDVRVQGHVGDGRPGGGQEPSTASARRRTRYSCPATKPRWCHSAGRFAQPGQPGCVHDQATELADRPELVVDGGGERIDVLGTQRPVGLDDDHPGPGVGPRVDAGTLVERQEPRDGVVLLIGSEDPQRIGHGEGGEPADTRIQARSVTTANAAKRPMARVPSRRSSQSAAGVTPA